MMKKAHEAFEQFKYELDEEMRDTSRYCYVKTVLGYLEVDVRSLLYVTARIISRTDVTEIDEAIIEAAVRAIQRLPDCLLDDLWGLRYEEFVRERFDLVFHRRTPDEKTLKTSGLELLELLFRTMGPASLKCNIFRDIFVAIFSSDGDNGQNSWQKLIASEVKVKRRRGRPRKSEYDVIFQERTGGTESYGKLIRRIRSSDSVSPEVFLNRVKAAVAYRKRKGPGSENPAIG
jgi:hypothetical protein